MFSSYIKKTIQEFSYRNFNSVVVFEERDLKSFQINNPERPYFYESMYKTSTRDQSIVQTVLDEYFVLPSELKRTFYKTWEEITEKTRTELLIDQIIHYWDFDANSIPNDNVAKLPDEIQTFAKEIKVIKSLNLSDFIENLKDYIYMSTTVQKKDIELIQEFIKPLSEELYNFKINIDVVESKELKNVLYEVLDTVPQDAEEFMRYLVYRLTGETLLIKNNELIEKLRNSNRTLAISLIIKYSEKIDNALVELAKIFNRYKPIFLALKCVNGSMNFNPVINEISRLSKKYHKPKVTPDYMKITEGGFSIDEVKDIVKDLDTVYLIKLYNAVSYRCQNPKVLIYQIRNGKVFIKENKHYDKFEYITYYEEVEKFLGNMILKRIKTNIKELGISFKNRDKVNLCVPTSGKQFVGNFPFYSSFYIDWKQENAYIGIYWKNTETNRIDLDLSLSDEKQKLGWNTDYYNNDAIYSGDITDAPNGAVEAFKINLGDNFYSVNVNKYSGPDKLDFKLFIGKDNFSDNVSRDGKEMFENTSIPFSTQLELESGQQNIGFVVDNSLVLCNLRVSDANVSDIQSEDVIDSYKKLILSKLKLNNIKINSVLPQDIKYVLDFENPDKNLLMKLVK